MIPFLLALIPMVSWGIMDVISGTLGRRTKAIVVLFGVQFAGLILLAPLAPQYGLQAKDWLTLILLGLLPVFAWLFYLKAANLGDISVAGPVSRTNFVIASILGIIFLHEGITFGKLAGIIVVLGGGILLSLGRSSTAQAKNTVVSAGIFAAFSALSSGLLLFFLAAFSRSSGWYATTFFLRLGVASFAFLGLLPNKNYKEIASNRTPWLLITIAALADVIGLSAYNIAVSHYAVSYVSVIASCAPLVTLIIARAYLKERLTWFQYGGVALMLLGIAALQIQL